LNRDSHPEQNCPGVARLIRIGGELYFKGADDSLPPTRKDQPPPDLRYFNQARNNGNALLNQWRRALSAVPSGKWLEFESGVVSGVFNLESPGVEAPGGRPRHDERYHEI
jgi:hypothetical protein